MKASVLTARRAWEPTVSLPKLGGTARGHRFVLDANKCSANVVFAVVSSAQLRRRTAPDRSEWTSGAPLLRDSNRV